MSTFYVIGSANSINNTAMNGNGVILDAGDNILVKAEGSVLATGQNGTGIYLDAFADGSSATIAGLVYGTSMGVDVLAPNAHVTVTGQVLNGINMAGQFDSLTIGASGQAIGPMYLSGENMWLDNAGTIDVGNNAIQLSGDIFIANHNLMASDYQLFGFEGGGEAHINNMGVMHGGINSNLESTDIINIDNSGTWVGDIDAANGDDYIVNTGLMNGGLYLRGGNDTVDSHAGHVTGFVFGGDGNDYIVTGSEDNEISGGTGADYLDGGAGVNSIDYSGSLQSVTIDLSHNIAKHGDAAGDMIKNFQNVTGSMRADTLTGDNGANDLNGVIGNDTINGLGGDDTITMLGKNRGHLNGGEGNDTFVLHTVDQATYGAAFSANSLLDGANGFDTVELVGQTNVVFNATTMLGVERIQMQDGFNYALTTHDATVAAGQTMHVDGSMLGTFVLNFNGGAELDGNFVVDGGGAKDFIVTGAGSDVLNGGGNIDMLTGGGGADTFIYSDVTDSTSTKYDTITDFNANSDHISVGDLPAAMDAMVATGALSAGSFNNDLKAALNGHLMANDAILFHATTGGLAGHTILVVDANGAAGYQANGDYVIDVTGFTGSFDITDFA
jgi:Ca2+-binding RTX toxin-like protein